MISPEHKPQQHPETKLDCLILGSGIAGLFAALELGRRGHSVILVAKLDAMKGATRYAQGGIASVWSKNDSFAEHISVTLRAGAGLCHENIVQLCVEEGPARIRELIEFGVQFTKSRDTHPSPESHGTLESTGSLPVPLLDLHLEGGHRKRRLLP